MVSCPTGALTNRKVLDVELPHGDDMSADELQSLPIFARMSGTFLELNQGAVVRRRFKPGEVICREGEFGSTAFYILERHGRGLHRHAARARPRRGPARAAGAGASSAC